MSFLRDFCTNVVPKLKIQVAVEDGKHEAEAKRKAEAEAKRKAEAEAEQKAEAAAYKAEIMKRLSAVVGSYKEAVAAGGSDAKELQTQLADVKACIAKHHYSQAAAHLDLLEDLLATRSVDDDQEQDEEWDEDKDY